MLVTTRWSHHPGKRHPAVLFRPRGVPPPRNQATPSAAVVHGAAEVSFTPGWVSSSTISLGIGQGSSQPVEPSRRPGCRLRGTRRGLPATPGGPGWCRPTRDRRGPVRGHTQPGQSFALRGEVLTVGRTSRVPDEQFSHGRERGRLDPPSPGINRGRSCGRVRRDLSEGSSARVAHGSRCRRRFGFRALLAPRGALLRLGAGRARISGQTCWGCT